MFDMASILRRLAALEARNPASLRFGRVVGIDEGATVRVQLPDGQDVVSAPLVTLQRRVLKDQEIKLPDIGEPVAVLFSGQGGGQETGVILGAVYSPVVPNPQQEPHMEFSRFEDGTTILYDRKKHKLYADIKGDIDVKATGNANIAIQGNVDTSVGKNATLTVQGSVDIKAQKAITLTSSVSVNLDAPIIGISGILQYTGQGGKAGKATFSGDVAIENGGLQVPDNDVTASSVSLASHTHACKEGGTGSPSGG